jgi:hypothetical protein
MIAAKARLEVGHSIRDMAEYTGLSRALIGHAAVVLEHAPDLADQVIAGGSLDERLRVPSASRWRA